MYLTFFRCGEARVHRPRLIPLLLSRSGEFESVSIKLLSAVQEECSSMDRAISRWCMALEPALNDEEAATLTRLVSRTYTVYGTMLLLPPNTIDGPQYRDVFQSHGESVKSDLYKHIAREMKITHIAVNRPIPVATQRSDTSTTDSENTIRAPLNFQPLYGDFGPSSCASPPSLNDLAQAYWVTAKQNGISQSWAPRWTMFSRGNISEKARILTLPSVNHAVAEGARSGRGCSVVDLYAGIGYFTFSYIKAGAAKVLCWELNEWSCEGLRRGVKANRWTSATYEETSLSDLAARSEQILIFNESNERALQRIDRIRALLPPIRHVNCGLLPTSRKSYPIALAALDFKLGGWIHVHENFGVDEIDERASQVTVVFQRLLDEQEDNARRAELVSIYRVKTYAPGVFHCVVDIYITST